MKLRDALPDYLAEQGLPEHGGSEGAIDWIGAFGLNWPIPNPPIRKAILPMHDAHHIVTGYGTDAVGEAEVAAWALAAGGPTPLIGWVYDGLGFGFGMLQAPKRTTRAFYSGCGCQTVYALGTATVLRTEIQQLREHTQIDESHTRTWRDHAAYAKNITLALVMPFVAMPLMAVVMLQRPTATVH
jgi:hypothetical protein